MNEVFQGIAVSPGIAIGQAYCQIETNISRSVTCPNAEQDELVLFEKAHEQTVAELEALHDKVQTQVGKDEAGIFRAHLTIAHDALLVGKIRRLISEHHKSSEGALQTALADYEQLLSQVDDEYMRDRLVDVRDVVGRMIKHVLQVDSATTIHVEPVILIAHEMLPSDVVTVADSNVVGIVTASGGRTSHAAILARSYGIPAVAGLRGITSKLKNGDTTIIDGGAGRVVVRPNDEQLQNYGDLSSKIAAFRKSLDLTNNSTPRTKDGNEIELLANISCVADAVEAGRVGASGIGLYRTEFFYLRSAHIPTEDEQFAEYRRVLDAVRSGPITIRTYDLGGDKTIPFLTHAPEANPFMGWRSIRLSFEHPELLLQQIRAVIRASVYVPNEVKLLFPMITVVDELQRIHEFVEVAKTEVRNEGNELGTVKLGMMLEVPAAAVMLRELLDYVDFVSIGTNDLVQYLTAADRDNPKVSYLCQALSPAVLRVLAEAIATCRDARVPVSVCGEMAGSVRAFPVLLGMGLRSFSMSPSFVPVIRDLAECISTDEAESIFGQTAKLLRASEIQSYLDDLILRIRPELRHFLIA